MGDDLAAANVNRSYSLAATSIAIFTFMLFFLYPRFASGEINALLFQATLVVMGVATFLCRARFPRLGTGGHRGGRRAAALQVDAPVLRTRRRCTDAGARGWISLRFRQVARYRAGIRRGGAAPFARSAAAQ